ncbi:type III glutamate--ammonia ligase [Thioalkalivibrio denitrificans]|uniref:Type III glutamate--ammonia ligase n=1 Tax=Thioalkalivibrio denitrificans TaxID=108003 RepID=A0A1V3NMU0_9GAMM|nr:type III glutamate--ammonia ligase [Thioalkalivibrio denitrificans]OOG26417.1 type III glutamate--ammonia ligase [Thioalkalivibrio denitrificans]
MTPQEAKTYLESHQVKYILAQFVDIHGVAKTKSVPVSHLEDVLTDGAGFAGFAVWGLRMGPHEADYMARGDLSTLSIVPWQPGYARIVCDGFVNGKPYMMDTRNILAAQVKRLKERGWTMNTGLEPEFSLLRRDGNGGVVPADDSDRLDKPCYDYKGLSRSREFLERLVESLQAVDFDVYQVDHEDANGQFEINYTYSDCMTSADRYVFFRMAAGEIANQLGLICSFMPKPFSNRTGNGMHMHISIADETNPNLFEEPSDPRGLSLSKTAYHFMAGLMDHAPALTALMAPSVNSYKRLVVGRALSGATWAPAFISYGDNNRTSMVRVPQGRLELRLGDGACNPYLAAAAVIVAGLDGVDRKLDPGEPQNFNFYDFSPTELAEKGIETLPQSLHEAIEALRKDTLFAEQLGQAFIDEFVGLKNMEWVEYSRHVSDWELSRYVEFY